MFPSAVYDWYYDWWDTFDWFTGFVNKLYPYCTSKSLQTIEVTNATAIAEDSGIAEWKPP